MSDIYELIGKKIRALRVAYGGKGISQESLASELGATANTVSRWETATYKPSVGELERIARFFGVPMSVFFPNLEPNPEMQALLSATGDLEPEDLEELTRYALFRKARKELSKSKRKR